MVTYYIASSSFHQIISQSIQEAGYILDGGDTSGDVYLKKFVKENFSRLGSIDEIVIDLCALKDLDEEIISALEVLKVNYSEMRIIILAANRYEGDDLLTKCFQMAIYDLIVSEDYLEIHNELLECLKTGKTYKDSIRFKDAHPAENVVVKTEIKQVVSKVLIGIIGAGSGVGCTHNSIVLANFLRKKGFMVALAEINSSGAFKKIQDAYDLQMFDDRYFSMAGIDYYPGTTSDSLGNVLGKSYNFIICDFGTYENAERVLFGKCDIRIIIAGTKPWEMDRLNLIFAKDSSATLAGYQYCFNGTPSAQMDDVRQGMGELKNVYFLNATIDPFSAGDFSGAEIILKEYLPEEEKTQKKGFFRKR